MEKRAVPSPSARWNRVGTSSNHPGQRHRDRGKGHSPYFRPLLPGGSGPRPQQLRAGTLHCEMDRGTPRLEYPGGERTGERHPVYDPNITGGTRFPECRLFLKSSLPPTPCTVGNNGRLRRFLLLRQRLEDSILSGKLALGQEIPSIRSLAVIFQVNPNTAQRALSLLREEKLIRLSSRRRFFVTRDALWIRQCKERKAKSLVLQLRASLSAPGYEWNEIPDAIIAAAGVTG